MVRSFFVCFWGGFTCCAANPTTSGGPIFLVLKKDCGERQTASSQASYPSFCPLGGKSSVTPLLLLSPPNPLRWALAGAPICGPLDTPFFHIFRRATKDMAHGVRRSSTAASKRGKNPPYSFLFAPLFRGATPHASSGYRCIAPNTFAFKFGYVFDNSAISSLTSSRLV